MHFEYMERTLMYILDKKAPHKIHNVFNVKVDFWKNRIIFLQKIDADSSQKIVIKKPFLEPIKLI